MRLVTVLVVSLCCVVSWLFGFFIVFFVFKQKTAYEMRISDWSSDVCSSDLRGFRRGTDGRARGAGLCKGWRARSAGIDPRGQGRPLDGPAHADRKSVV